ncbi:MAG TPA: hypothetical protein VGV68_09910 [Terriglobia bacterium]|nr:hypothetical protein [Terriglobia bacterium]
MKEPEFVAILEDNVDFSHDLEERLLKSGIGVRAFKSRQDFKQSVGRGDHYDAIILDWYLDDQTSSVIAQLVLDDLRQHLFVPVVVYTEERGVAEGEIPKLLAPFNRIQVFDKGEIAPETLVAEVKKWYKQSMGATMSAVWRSVRQNALEKSLYELDALEGENFHRTLQHILVMDTGDTPDVDHALEFLERYVGRKVLFDATLRDELKKELGEARKNLKTTGERELALIHAHRYILPTDSVARTGDVVKILDESDALVALAVVITPACDLDGRKCFELRLVLAEERSAASGVTSECLLPAIRRDDGAFADFVLNFHSTMFLRDKSIGPTNKEREGRLISYQHSFEDTFGRKLGLRPICRLDDPYRSDLLQKYSSHASRVGIP